jgi:PhnB protein
MHARLEKNGAVLMASDAQMEMSLRAGEDFSVSINCQSVEEEEWIFTALREGGTVTMELQATF